MRIVGEVAAAAVLSIGLAEAATASQEGGDVSCLGHITREERSHAIPEGLLKAIGIAESGRTTADGQRVPRPWTVNATGQGQFFQSKEDAVAFVQELRAQGVDIIDVGCMQVNLYHHPNAFTSLDAAFDPATNVAYAARFLKDLSSQTGDWGLATQYYHSRTPFLGKAYSERVRIAGLGMTEVGPVTPLSGDEKAALRAEAPELLAVADRYIATSPWARWRNMPMDGLTASSE